MKKSIITLGLTLFSLIVFSQVGVHIGIKGGVNFAGISGVSDLNPEGITSFHGGAYVRVKILKFSLQPEIIYSSQGAQLSSVSDINLDYVTVPVMVMFHLPLGFNIHAGPQFGFLTDNATYPTNVNSAQQFFKDTDTSLGIGVGWGKKINVTARYLVGLSDISPDNIQQTVRNNVFQLSLGFDLFGIGG